MSASCDADNDLIAGIIAENTVNDYYTAEVRCEVIIDMLIAPVIGDIVTDLTGYKDVKLLAREFPLVKEDIAGGNGNSLRSVNADYLLYGSDENGDRKMIVVELKTDRSSLDDKQLRNYLELLGNQNINMLDGFKRILTKYSDCGYTSPGGRDLKTIFADIVGRGHSGDDPSCDKADRSNKADIARQYLSCRRRRGLKESNSRKYLLQAGQILDACDDPESLFERGRAEIELLYVLPDDEATESFRSMLNRYDEAYFNKIGYGSLSGWVRNNKRSSDPGSYTNWLVKDVLSQLFVDGDEV
ncbi:MAG: hypothetical protein K6G43_02000 [Lachnospiraceae bacterium]|nr:hypothetical protein [Lachnospiraceae bacterium]